MCKTIISELSQDSNIDISRRDFLKLKGLMLLWFYFLNSLGVNIFADELIKRPDYSLLDRLLELPFSNVVKKELKLRVFLQKKYCYDGNGNLHSLNRFLKEITNHIVLHKNFNDFKLLNSINDSQIDYTYMFNCTAKHNQINSLEYLQKKLISLKDNDTLTYALEYAINSQSYETTIHLMKQKIKLDTNVQNRLLSVLQREEYDNFYKKISTSKNRMLLPYRKAAVPKKRYVEKMEVKSTLGSDMYYKYEDELYASVYNATVDLYLRYLVDDFSVEYHRKRIDVKVWNHNNLYPIDLLIIYEQLLQMNGFDRDMFWNDQIFTIDRDYKKAWEFKIRDSKSRFLIDDEENHLSIELYDLINIEVH